jgi:hypothetical protein
MRHFFYCYFLVGYGVLSGRSDMITMVRCVSLGLQIYHFRLFDAQRIEGIPRFLVRNTHADPLGHNLLLSGKHGTAGMFGKARVHGQGGGVNVAKENGRVFLRLDMDTGVAKVGMTTVVGNGTVHDHGRHARTGLELIAGAVAVAVGRVPIGLGVVPTPAKVLDAHEVFLAVFFNVQAQNVVGVLETNRSHPSNQ